MTEFKDPEDKILKLTFELIRVCNNSDNVIQIIEEALPGWLDKSSYKYCKDYPTLTKNWEILCQKTNTTPKKIYTVKEIIFDKEHILQHIFCERLTREGYIIRRNTELIFCDKCNAAIPAKEIYTKMKHLDLQVPEVWNNKCKNCI
jgi:hypothetical protein